MQHREHWHRTPSSEYRVRPARADVGRLAEIARSLARARPLWERLVRHDPAQRGFTRLYSTPEVEAWLLTWAQEQAIELHDHGGSSGAVMVVAGELTESFTDLVTRSQLRELTWPRGSAHFFDANHVHDLQNRGAGVATSIHVYSPPLSSMTFYDHRPETFLKPLRVEPVRSDAPIDHAPTS